jgi:hypothetical protein
MVRGCVWTLDVNLGTYVKFDHKCLLDRFIRSLENSYIHSVIDTFQGCTGCDMSYKSFQQWDLKNKM